VRDAVLENTRIRRLFFALALLYVLPFWTVRYLPMMDGACHTYNAWILRQHGNVEQYPLFNEYYEINARPYPNWISQGTMALLMFVVPPLVAEKLLVSGYMLLFLGGMWYLAGSVRPEERWLAFLAFPFAWNQLFQFGFYNFSFSLAFFPWIVGCWWQHRSHCAAPGPRFAVNFALKINLLLWLCYFSHILSFALALIAIGVLWLATLRRESWRRHLLHIPILLPQILLPIWFFLQKTGGEIPAQWGVKRLFLYFAGLRVLVTLRDAQQWVAGGVVVLFLALFALTLGRKVRRPVFEQEDTFLLLALLTTLLYAVSPQGLAGGAILKPRLSLYPWLLLIPWLSPGLSPRVRKAVTGALALGALLYLGYMTHLYRVYGAEVSRYLAALEPIRPNTRVLPLLFERTRPTDVLSHAFGYKALEKGLIDWDNYEAKVSFFPTRFRSSAVLPDVQGVFTAAETFKVQRNLSHVDAVYTWKMPADLSLRDRLKRDYTRVSERFGGELYEIPGIESPHARLGRGPGPDRRRPRGRPPGGSVGGM
jgi:hypothetical protein